jgi:hypothetical protein
VQRRSAAAGGATGVRDGSPPAEGTPQPGGPGTALQGPAGHRGAQGGNYSVVSREY